MSTPTEDPPQREDKPEKPTLFVLSDSAANWVILTVTALWALSNIISMANKVTGYSTPAEVHGAFMIIVGGAFMIRVKGS